MCRRIAISTASSSSSASTRTWRLRALTAHPTRASRGVLDFKAMAAHAREMIAQFDIRAGEGAGHPRLLHVGRQPAEGHHRPRDRPLPRTARGGPAYPRPRRGGPSSTSTSASSRSATREGAVLLVSFELDEILDLCDRIAAISKGEIVGVVDAKGADEREIGAMMAGLRTRSEPPRTAGARA